MSQDDIGSRSDAIFLDNFENTMIILLPIRPWKKHSKFPFFCTIAHFWGSKTLFWCIILSLGKIWTKLERSQNVSQDVAKRWSWKFLCNVVVSDFKHSYMTKLSWHYFPKLSRNFNCFLVFQLLYRITGKSYHYSQVV